MSHQPDLGGSQDSEYSLALDYSGFGSNGEEFQSMHNAAWEAVVEEWRELHNEIPIDDALNKAYCRSGYWFERLMTFAIVVNGMTKDELVSFWDNKFRQLFQPNFPSISDLLQDKEMVDLRIKLFAAIVRGRTKLNALANCRSALNTICYGAFSADEMNFLINKHRKIVEIGAGTGYFADVFASYGGDIVAIDNNSYGRSAGDEVSLWTKSLLEQGRLIIGGTEKIAQFAQDRTLLISWPEPGAAYPAEALKVYAACGGEHLVTKQGGFIGFKKASPGEDPAELDCALNIRQFFELLVQDWCEVAPCNQAPYVPRAYSDNLWVFERA